MAALLEVLLSPVGLTVVVVGAVLFLIAHIIYSHVYGPAFHVWKRYGIKGPKPSPFWGNFKLVEKLMWLKLFEDMYKIYGSVFGFYIGPKAMIVVADPDMLKEIMVKNFDSFVDRTDLPDIYMKACGLPSGLVLATGDSWRKGKQTISPSFSALKIKAMVPLVQRSCEVLQEKVGEIADSRKSVDVHRMFGDFAAETIFAVAFGHEIQIQRGEMDELANIFKVILSFSSELSILRLIFLLAHFPFLEHIFILIFKCSKETNAFKTLADIAVGLVQSRRKATKTAKYKDLLQLMLDANVEEKDGQRKLSDLEIVSNCITFILAGRETTACTLAYTSYLLALNPEVQEKLCAEIDESFEGDTDTESSMFETTEKLPYLDMVLQESLRVYPSAARITRQCLKTTQFCGVTIPKGAQVHIPIRLLHHIPEYWPDPEKFDPERFTPEEKAKRPQLSHMPFGWGLRNCVGMRFTLMEAKMALIYILRKYKFEQAPDTEIPLELADGFTMSPKNGIYLQVSER